jgi:hypothetical protein
MELLPIDALSGILFRLGGLDLFNFLFCATPTSPLLQYYFSPVSEIIFWKPYAHATLNSKALTLREDSWRMTARKGFAGCLKHRPNADVVIQTACIKYKSFFWSIFFIELCLKLCSIFAHR